MAEELKKNIQHLMKMYAVIKEEKDALLIDKIKLLEKVEERDRIIVELERKNKNLQVANAVASGENTDVAKKKIDNLIREVDKCIALLNV